MKVHLHGDVKEWSELNAGDLFGVIVSGEVCVGIKAALKQRNGDTIERCVMLTPSQRIGTPHVYRLENIIDYAFLELKHAVFVPGELAAVSSGAMPDAGEVVQTPDGPVLVVAHVEDYGRRSAPSVNLLTGAYSAVWPQQPFIGFNGWKVVVPSAIDGEHPQVICRWPTSNVKAEAA